MLSLRTGCHILQRRFLDACPGSDAKGTYHRPALPAFPPLVYRRLLEGC